MITVAVSQRIDTIGPHGERRDTLDRRWMPFFAACGVLPLLIPNHPATAAAMVAAHDPAALVLTGGNDLAAYGGDAPERDEAEQVLLAHMRSRARPVLGVCRGMQILLHIVGVPLRQINHHAGTRHPLSGAWGGREVNSFHNWAAVGAAGPFEVMAATAEGAVEAIRHPTERLVGIMWHPEREPAPEAADVNLVRSLLGA